MKRVYDWAAIQQFHNEGNGFVKCRKRFGCTHYSWVNAIKTGLLRASYTPFPDRRRRYDWSTIRAYYEEGHTYLECRARFGFCAKAWEGAVKRGVIKPRSIAKPMEAVLSSRSSRWTKKLKLIREGLFENSCVRCGISEWRGKPLAIHIDHINGVKNDWRLEKLRMLCPNCHSQTPTFSGRNLRNRQAIQGEQV